MKMGVTIIRRGVASCCAGLTVGALLFACTLPRADGAQGATLPSAIETFSFQTLDQGGAAYTQAGGHPYELTTTVILESEEINGHKGPKGTLKDLITELPEGLIGDPAATPRCALREAEEDRCGPASQIGLLDVFHNNTEESGIPVFNVVPPKGIAARFVAEINASADAFIDSGVRTGEGYGVTAGAHQVTELGKAWGVRLLLWGVPGEASHDAERSCSTTYGEGYRYVPCEETSEKPYELSQTPLLSEPTSCSGRELVVNARADFYQAANEYSLAGTRMPAVTGCSQVTFDPAVSVTPESSSTDSPTGVEVALKVPQDEMAEGLATADLKNATVTLPAGVSVNAAEASAVVGCPLLTGREAPPGYVGIDLEDAEPANCPQASKIGTVELRTPLIEHVLPGAVYLAQQGNAGSGYGSNPFGSLLALYIAIEDPETGVIVKLAGEVHADPTSGQLAATFDENPQLPFEELKVNFFGGQRSALATPMTCGAYATTSLLEPWSHVAPGEEGTPDASPGSSFQIGSMAGGGACHAPTISPSLVAGTTGNQAGSYGTLTTDITRKDGEGNFKTVSLTLPKGLLAKLSGVPLCDGADANAGSCPAGSQIGHVTVKAGVGTEPITLPEPGHKEYPVYLTGPYQGAAFGLSIVVHPEAGPFNLAEGAGTAAEKPIVVRASLAIDPYTAQATVTTPQSGPYSIPTILQGIPVDVQSMDVTVDRPDFALNPTSCEPTAVTGQVGSAEGASGPVSDRFQAAGCKALKFKPHLKLSLNGATGRTGHPALKAVLTYPKEGAYANIGRAQVNLPGDELLEQGNLNNTCTKPVLQEGKCPTSTVYGKARAWSPLLEKPLEGDVYLVGGFGYKLPALVAELDGQIRVLLVGKVDSGPNKGIRNTFEAVPDAPVSRFELSLKGGRKYGLLVNSKPLCEKPQHAIVRFTAQNGRVEQSKPTIAAGCKAKKKKAKTKSHARHHRRGGGKKH